MNSGPRLAVVITLSVLGSCVALGFANSAAAHHGGEHIVLAADTESGRTFVLTVEGMTCATGCAPKVEEALRGLEGVESVEVRFEDKQAIVRTAPEHSITQKDCDGALGNSGYFVDGIEEVEGDENGA